MGNNFSPFFKEGHSLLSVACLDNFLVLFQCFDEKTGKGSLYLFCEFAADSLIFLSDSFLINFLNKKLFLKNFKKTSLMQALAQPKLFPYECCHNACSRQARQD